MATKENVKNAVETKKVIRRGISNNTKVVSGLKFHEKDAASNGLFIGHLEKVSVEWSENKENSKQFPNMKLPRLVFHFQSNHTNVAERRNYYKTLFPVESNIDTIPGGNYAWHVDNIFNWIKYILDVFYLKGRELTEQEEADLSLPFVDFDEDGNYIPVEQQDVINGYRVIFETADAMLNGSYGLAEEETAKPCYKTPDGKILPCWLKLTRHKKVKGDWVNTDGTGDLAFDPYIGAGCIEIMKGQNPPAVLRLDMAKESITPKEVKKTPTIGGINSPMINGAGVIPTSAMPINNNDAFTEAQGDMPF